MLTAPDPGLLLQAVVVGFSIAAPVGPIGLLCLQRSLDEGPRIGLATGLGAACADAVYGAIGAYGVHTVIGWLTRARTGLALAGGLFLLWMAWQTWRDAPRERQAATVTGAGRDGAHRALQAYAGTFALTLSNPATILSFVAIFAALAGRGPVGDPAWMVVGVFAGSALWWLALSHGVSRLRHRLSARGLVRIRRASALLLGGFGLVQLAGLVSG